MGPIIMGPAQAIVWEERLLSKPRQNRNGTISLVCI